MKPQILTKCLYTYLFVSFNSTFSYSQPVFNSTHFGGAQNEKVVKVEELYDKIIVIGNFTGSITIGSTTLNSNGGIDSYLAVFSKNTPPYALLWIQHIGGSGDDILYDFTTEAWGTPSSYSPRINLCGSFENNLSVWSVLKTIHFVSMGGKDGLILSFDLQLGGIVDGTSVGGSGNDELLAIEQENTLLYVLGTPKAITCVGYFENTILINGFPLASVGQKDILVITYVLGALSTPGATFTLLEFSGFGGSLDDVATAITYLDGQLFIPSNSSTYCVAGYFESSLLTIGSVQLTNQSLKDVFLFTYNLSPNPGIVADVKSFGGTGNENVFDICIGNKNGNIFSDVSVYGIGFTESNLLTDEVGNLYSIGNNGFEDILWFKFDISAGTLGHQISNVFIKSYGGNGHDFGYGLSSFNRSDNHLKWSSGAFGSIYMIPVNKLPVIYGSGSFENSMSLSSISLSSSNAEDAFWFGYDPAINDFTCAYSVGGSGYNDGTSIVWDNSSGNAYLTGNFPNNINIGSQSYSSYGQTDCYIAKVGCCELPDGFLNGKSHGDNGFDGITDICIDNAGNIFATGQFSSSIVFYNSSGNVTLTGTTGGFDGFIAKFNSNYECIWATSFSSASSGSVVSPQGIAIDINGNIVITGFYTGSITINATTYISSNSSGVYFENIFTLSYSPTFASVSWVNIFSGLENDRSLAVSIDPSNNIIYIAGWFKGSLTVGGTTYNSAGKNDLFYAKISSSGTLAWIYTAGSAEYDAIHGLTINQTTNKLYLTGSINFIGSNFTYAATSLNQLSWSNGEELFIACHNLLTGALVWIKRGGGSLGTSLNSLGVAVDNSGNSYITGYITSQCCSPIFQFEGSSITHNIFGANLFYAKFNVSGNNDFAVIDGTSYNGMTRGEGISVKDNRISIVGTFQASSISLGGITLNRNGTTLNDDLFLINASANSGSIKCALSGGGAGNDFSKAIEVDNLDKVIVGGSFENSASFGLINLNSSGFPPSDDAFLLDLYCCGD
jgi:hypothetical protein